MNKVVILKFPETGLIRCVFETNEIIIHHDPDEKNPNHLSLRSVFTNKEDHKKGYFKKNLKNTLNYIKNERGLKGLVVIESETLSDFSKAVIKTGIKNGWIKKIGNQHFIEEIK